MNAVKCWPMCYGLVAISGWFMLHNIHWLLVVCVMLTTKTGCDRRRWGGWCDGQWTARRAVVTICFRATEDKNYKIYWDIGLNRFLIILELHLHTCANLHCFKENIITHKLLTISMYVYFFYSVKVPNIISLNNIFVPRNVTPVLLFRVFYHN